MPLSGKAANQIADVLLSIAQCHEHFWIGVLESHHQRLTLAIVLLVKP